MKLSIARRWLSVALLGAMLKPSNGGDSIQAYCQRDNHDEDVKKNDEGHGDTYKSKGNTKNVVISNGVIMLGVSDAGRLNVPGSVDAHDNEDIVGLRYFRDGGWYDSTSYGCKCEGKTFWSMFKIDAKVRRIMFSTIIVHDIIIVHGIIIYSPLFCRFVSSSIILIISLF